MSETAEVVIVGAGPAGLAAAGCLRKARLSFIILERETHLAPSWRRHYDRLQLHTVKQFSSLPHLAFPKSYPRYVSKDLLIEYLETYAERFGIEPRFGELVRSVRREGACWYVQSTSSSIRARFVVIASGYNAEPFVPSFAGMEAFQGQILHSSSYANAKPFLHQSVLVVGMGNSGAEIALDLLEGGASPTISMRNGVHIAPRNLFGVPIQIVALLATAVLPRGLNDLLFPPILDFALGNPARYGIRRPELGLLQQIAKAKIPVIDIGTFKKIAAGEIKIAPGIAEVWNEGVDFTGGGKGRFDAIILATGYRPNYQSFLEFDLASEDSREDGLFFIGFRNVATGLLHEISKESAHVAKCISGLRKREQKA
jgi:Pyridine nucleotide-disulphide oxidoreductase